MGVSFRVELGKNDNIESNPISLVDILNEVYLVIHEARELVGGRVVILECEDCEKLINLYKEHGFKLIDTEGDDQVNLRTMYIHIEEA